MNVKLVSLTKAVIEEAELTAEELIVYTARVSNPENQLNTETADRLIAYLIRKKHWSPFQMVDMTVEIQTSRAIAHQIIRHGSNSFQEFSQRYSSVLAFEPIEIRMAGSNNRQSSTEAFNPDINVQIDEVGGYVTIGANEAVDMLLRHVMSVYKGLIEAGVARECARFILPEAAQTTLYMKGNIRSWIHYLQVRLEESTQKEHRLVAEAVLSIFKDNFPNISKALEL